MPLWVAAILGGFIQAAGTLVGRVLVSLGIGYTVFSGLDTSLNWARDYLITKIGGLGSVALGVASVAQVGTCISILVSALGARLLFKGMVGGAMRTMGVKS